MIKVWCEHQDGYFMSQIRGHAGAEKNSEGHDLVCCSVSMLVQTLAYSLKRIPDISVKARMESGDAELIVTKELNCSDQQWQLASARITMYIDGLMLLINQYPQCIECEKP